MDRLGQVANLVKMDCEGGEWAILRDRECLDPIKHLALEYNLDRGEKNSVPGLVGHLKAHGVFIDSLRESSNRTCGLVTAHKPRHSQA
jgi:hypothetical protein